MKKINILQIIILTINEIKSRPLYFVKFGLPLLLIPIIEYIFNYVGFYLYGTSLIHSWLPVVLPYILDVLILSMVLIACHRIFLMNNDDIQNTRIFRFGIREWNFIAWWIKVGLILYIPILLIALLLSSIKFDISDSLSIIMYIPIIYIVSRLSLVFPATAVGNKIQISFRHGSYHKTMVGG